jgi:tetratricopeptide (TPR) repeat protein
LVFFLLGTQVVFIFADEAVPTSLRDNQYLYESLRLNNLARLAYADGDYEASTTYAEEAIRYSYFSDDYVFMRLKMMEADTAIDAARQRLDYAASLNIAALYPTEYNRAQASYSDARAYRLAESWDNAIAAANQALAALSGIDFAAIAMSQTQSGGLILPSQYTVRSWQTFRDCLWNIAGRSWVYNDPYKWPLLFEANRSKMPDPNNANLIHPGMVLDIPSISGEVRQGMWESGVSYPSF